MKVIRTWQEVDKNITDICPSCSEIVTKKLVEVSCEELGFKDNDSFLSAMDVDGLKLLLKTSIEENKFELCEQIKNKITEKTNGRNNN